MSERNPAEHVALGGNGGRSEIADYERTAQAHLMMNLKAMDPAKRKEWAERCSNVVLRSLLPPPPTERELADAKRVLAALAEVDADQHWLDSCEFACSYCVRACTQRPWHIVHLCDEEHFLHPIPPAGLAEAGG